MHIAVFYLVVILLFGAGCATTGTVQVTRGQELLANSQNVVLSLDQLSYQPAVFGDPIKVTFDEQTVVFQEGDKRRFAKGFSLPSGKAPYSVNITSYKGGTLYDPAIMYPEVQILDRRYQVIRTLPCSDFVFRPSLSGEGLNTVFFINNDSQGEFLLLANRSMSEAELITSQSNITSSTAITVPVSGGFFMWFIPTGHNTAPLKMKASPTGEMEIEFREYRPKKIGE